MRITNCRLDATARGLYRELSLPGGFVAPATTSDGPLVVPTCVSVRSQNGDVEAGDWIALAALVIAIAVGVVQYRLQKVTATTQNQIQERLAAIEEERRSEEITRRSVALIVCEKRKEPTASGRLATWIVFTNLGQAVARDIWFERGPLEPLITSGEEDHYPRLAPGQEWKILADPTMGDPERIIFRYGWTDDFGEHEEETVYSVFT